MRKATGHANAIEEFCRKNGNSENYYQTNEKRSKRSLKGTARARVGVHSSTRKMESGCVDAIPKLEPL